MRKLIAVLMAGAGMAHAQIVNPGTGTGGAVSSVAGKTGAVTLAPTDVGAIPITGGTATGPVTAPALGNVLQAEQSAGASPSDKIIACLQTARSNFQIGAGRAVCDARSFAGAQTMTGQIEVYEGTTLLLPLKAVWSWDLRDGTSVGILQDSSSAIVGECSGGGGCGMRLVPGSNSTNMLALYATQATAQGSESYIIARGFYAGNGAVTTYSGAVFAKGVMYLRNMFDESSFTNVMAENCYGDAMHIADAGDQTAFRNMQAISCYGAGGGTPLTFEGGGQTSVIRWQGTANHAGAGKPNVAILSGNDGNNIHLDVYSETGSGANNDPTTATIDNQSNGVIDVEGMINGDTAKPAFSRPTAPRLRSAGLRRNNYFTQQQVVGQIVGGTGNSDALLIGDFTPGQIYAGQTSFIPSAVGWYRVYSGKSLQGRFELATSDPPQAITGMVNTSWYGGPSTLAVLGSGFTLGGSRTVDQIQVSTNNSDTSYMDVHVANTSTSPVYINFFGQGVRADGIVAAVTSGAVATANSACLVDVNYGNVGGTAINTCGSIVAPQLATSGPTPTAAFGPAAGTSPSNLTITGTNMDHTITFTTGTATTANDVVATITFNGTLANAPRACIRDSRNSGGASNYTVSYTTAPTTTTYTINSGTTALAASTAISWSVTCR